jgi:ubiquinone/menaquinone biosynthesis C-methylase UbiE
VFRLLGPFRRVMEDRKRILGEAGVKAGMRVADVGAGYGYFALPAAAIVGAQGEVLAVEPDPRRADDLAKSAASGGVSNLRVIQSKAEEMAQIPTGTVDLALVMSSFHHMSDGAAALREIRRILKPGGEVYMRELKAGKVFKHGSRREGFERVVGAEFPGARFEETRGFLIARANT